MGNTDFRVPRRAWYKPLENDRASVHETTQEEERWLSEWRDETAYVLLGDPGSGKTESLRAEAAALACVCISAALIQEGLAPPVSADAVVFIDAIDEAKGSGSGNIVGAVARYLRDNGKPRFRIACREADWRVDADRALLEAVAPSGKVKELHLCPLSDDDIKAILQSRSQEVPEANAFLEQAHKQGVQDWLRNPMLLDLMVESVADNGQLPTSRLGIYESACHAMAQEHNDRHREQQALNTGVVQNVLEDAGTFCALLLLSGKSAISKSALPAAQALALPTLPKELQLHNAKQAVKSKLFSTEGDQIRPRHRTIAEFLGAQALAKRIQEGLPLSRVLALVQGHDGAPVEAMRGLCAWLAVHLHGEQRRLVLQADTLGFIINGDAAELTHDERLQLIRALHDLSEQNPWFRNGQWESHPFGPLATPDMKATFEHALSQPERDKSHQAFIDCMLDALQFSPEAMPTLVPVLARWVEDGQAEEYVRAAAYRAWRKHAAPDTQGEQVITWLNAFEEHREQIRSLIELLLEDAYPKWIQAEVLRFLPREQNYIAVWYFWPHQFMRLTPPGLLPSLANAWRTKFPKGLYPPYGFSCEEVQSELLRSLLEHHGDSACAQELYEWLAIGLDAYGFPASSDDKNFVVEWLNARPDAVKAVAAMGWQSVQANERGQKLYPPALQRLRDVTFPNDWVRWQMGLALNCDDKDMVLFLVQAVKGSVLQANVKWGLPSEQEMTAWVEKLNVSYPDARDWLLAAETEQLDSQRAIAGWEKERQLREARADEQRKHDRSQRQKQIKPFLEKWPSQALPDRMLNNLAQVYLRNFTNIKGETPESRIAEYLGTDSIQEVNIALQAIDSCLTRQDWPSLNDVIQVSEKSTLGNLVCHRHCLPALLAAHRACKRDTQAWRSWHAQAQQVLTAFWLTYGMGDEPLWFVPLGAEYPEVVAPALLLFAANKFKSHEFHSFTGLQHLSREPSWQSLAVRVLPELLTLFPVKAGESACRVLNRDLLSALHLLPKHQAKKLVEQKLAIDTLDSGQRMAWLVAWLGYEPAQAMHALVEYVGSQHRRVQMMGETLRAQNVLSNGMASLPVACVQRLVELFAPLANHDLDKLGGFVTQEQEQVFMVRALISNLGNNPAPEAATALQALASNHTLNAWQVEAAFHLQQQRRLQRELAFKPASVQAVSNVLCKLGPANHADLLALVVDHLKGLEAELRGDPAFQLRHFWQGDTATAKAKKQKRDCVPSEENDCTKELQAVLRPRLNILGVDLQSESQAANDKRMDLRVTYIRDDPRMSLPIEAKSEDNAKVWTAWRDQLQRLYTNDPATKGHGIYLVYWFGISPKTAPPLDGSKPNVKPQSAQDMQTMLEERIPAKDRHLIKVVVLDLSWPETPRPQSVTIN